MTKKKEKKMQLFKNELEYYLSLEWAWLKVLRNKNGRSNLRVKLDGVRRLSRGHDMSILMKALLLSSYVHINTNFNF